MENWAAGCGYLAHNGALFPLVAGNLCVDTSNVEEDAEKDEL
jgi:hypothetical protein